MHTVEIRIELSDAIKHNIWNDIRWYISLFHFGDKTCIILYSRRAEVIIENLFPMSRTGVNLTLRNCGNENRDNIVLDMNITI